VSRPLPTRIVLLAPLLASSLLHAEDPEPVTRFGLQVTVSAPRQDLRDITSRNGLGGGISFEQEMEGGWSLRTRFDYVAFREDQGMTRSRLAAFAPPNALRIAADQASLGMEVRGYLPGQRKVFVLGGLMGTRLEFRTLLPADPGDEASLPTWGKEKTSFKLGMAAGAGYRFSDGYALSLRYGVIPYDGLSLTTVEAALEVRF